MYLSDKLYHCIAKVRLACGNTAVASDIVSQI